MGCSCERRTPFPPQAQRTVTDDSCVEGLHEGLAVIYVSREQQVRASARRLNCTLLDTSVPMFCKAVAQAFPVTRSGDRPFSSKSAFELRMDLSSCIPATVTSCFWRQCFRSRCWSAAHLLRSISDLVPARSRDETCWTSRLQLCSSRQVVRKRWASID